MLGATATATALDLERVACNLCGEDDAELLLTQTDSLTHYPEPFRVVRCRRCGLVYVNPRPKLEDIGRFYTPEFVSYQFESNVDPARATWRDKLMAKMVHGLAVQRIKKVRKFITPDANFRVLDVGCGKGHFLHQLKTEVKCDVSGLDIDEKSVRYCEDELQIPVIHGNMTALESRPEYYDLVTMWHFLEHESDPLGSLAKIRQCLKPGGVLYIEVPNQASLENRLFGWRSYLYDAPRHLYDFSPKTIQALLTKAGVEPIHVSCTSGSGGWLGSVQEVATGGRVYRNLRGNISKHVLFWLMFGPLDFLTSFTKVGSIMDAVGRK